MSRTDRLYVFFACAFVGMLMLTNIIGTKLFIVFEETFPEGFFGTAFVLTTGIITYPVTFWLTDVVSELWGKKRADLMVIYGFLMSLVMLVFLQIARALPPADAWRVGADFGGFFHPDHQRLGADGQVLGADSLAAQAAYSFTFEAPGVLLFASMTAYMVAQLLDNFMFHFWKRVTKGKHLWLRNNGSTLVSQLVDTIIVNSIFLYFVFELPFFASESGGVTILQIIVTVYVFKALMAFIDTPFIYAGVHLIQRVLPELRQDYEAQTSKP